MFSINLSSFVFGRRTSTFAALVAGFGMDRRGALRIIEIGNGFAGRKIEELEILTLFNHLFQET